MAINYEVTVGYMRPALRLIADLGYEPKTLLDIGANMGHFVHLVHSEFPACDPTVIEPNPDCYSLLSEYDLKRFAVGKQEGNVTFYRHPSDPTSGGNSIYKENSVHFQDAEETKVPMKRLDDLHVHGELIKLDVQGAEVDVINGGRRTFSQAKFIITEGSYFHYNEGGCLVDDILKATSELGFRLIYNFGPAHGCHWYNGRPIQTDLLLAHKDLPIFSVV